MRVVLLVAAMLATSCGSRSADEIVAPKPAQVAAPARRTPPPAARRHDAAPPSEAPPVAVAFDDDAFASRARVASEAVAALARERRWIASAQRAAQALEAIAAMLEVAPLALDRAEWSALVLAVRYEATRLGDEQDLGLERSERVKAALVAAAGALQDMRCTRVQPVLAVLAVRAEQAAAAIDEHSSFVFQRGIVQEAFRATVDAYLIASTLPACLQAPAQV